jgi:RNA polymerase sigma-70 factor (ECF subfamily)
MAGDLSSPGQTSVSLLARLQQPAPDPDAWPQFVRRYGPLLYRWCRAWKLQEADAQDVTQMVLAKLARRLPAFQYDSAQSFRAYLKTLTHYAWCDLMAANQQPGAAGAGGSCVLQELAGVAARDDLAERLRQEFDQELLEQAMRQVQERVAGTTWDAFRLTALEGLSAADVAQRLGLRVTAVFKARSRVQQMLKEAVAQTEA